MNNTIYDYALMTVPLAVSFYTLSYALWLWRKKMLLGALGVGFLAFLATLYPGIILLIF
jgi:hypothetical protein